MYFSRLCVLVLGLFQCYQLGSAQVQDLDLAMHAALFAFELSKDPFDQIFSGIVRDDFIVKNILPTQESRTIGLDNITLPGENGESNGAVLYNVTCELVNISDINFNTTFYADDENLGVNIRNVSAIC